MAKYQLLYFPVRGRGQALRYLCLDNGIELEDTAVKWEDWLANIKATTPFGQLPVLKDKGNNVEVAQSNSMLRYLGRKHDLYPSDAAKCVNIDMMNDHVEDMRGAYTKLIYQNYDAGKDDFVKELPKKLAFIEKLLKAWGKDYISDKLCFADYNLFDLLDNHLLLAPGCLDAFPTTKAYYDRISERPAIKTYRDSVAFKKLPVNGNGKQ